MLDLAQQLIFERAKHPKFDGQIDNYTLKVIGANPLCGDELTFFLKLRGEWIEEIKFEARACAICKASSDFLAEQLQNKNIQNIQNITPDNIRQNLGIELSPTRLKCALLPLEALKQTQV